MSRKQATDKVVKLLEWTIEVIGVIIMVLPFFRRKRKGRK